MYLKHRAVVVLLGLVLLTTSFGAGAPAPMDPTITSHRIESFDGVEIALTVFQPAGATSTEPVPVILHSHGWSGSRAKDTGGIVGDLLDAGYGVVSVDARGHGESGGEANVHNRDVEVHDFRIVLDWIHDNLAWVQRDVGTGVAKDVVAGAVGGSYGGGYQLMTASADARLDALVPQMTWNDLTYSLAPNGVVKSVWVHALYGAAKASGTRINPAIDAWYREAMVTNEFPQEAFDHFKASSPTPGNIQAHVLLVQGIPDMLFNLNEAIANYEALEAGVAGDVRLVTYLGGHVLPTVQPQGTGAERGTEPCGGYEDLAVKWFDEHLRGVAGAADAIAEVEWALEDGTCLEANGLSEASVTFTPGTPVAVPQGAGSVLVPLGSVDGVIAGIPHLKADVLAPVGAIFQASLVVVDQAGGAHVVDDQAAGIRLEAGQTTLDVDLNGVATRVNSGDQLFLRLDGANEWYATNSHRVPGGIVLSGIQLTLPLADC